MKQYGATRVHPELLDLFITLIVDLHEFKLRPLLAILKEYGTIEKLELSKSENTIDNIQEITLNSPQNEDKKDIQDNSSETENLVQSKEAIENQPLDDETSYSSINNNENPPEKRTREKIIEEYEIALNAEDYEKQEELLHEYYERYVEEFYADFLKANDLSPEEIMLIKEDLEQGLL